MIWSTRGSASSSSGSWRVTGASRSIAPSSARTSTAIAVNDLLTDAIRMGVCAVTGAPVESCPYPAAWTTRSPCVTTADRPGTPEASWRSAR